MQLTNPPGKLVLPFAASGAKNNIPTASQVGIVAGAASLTDGFPPLTRTPLVAGGVPPSGLDMNGILNAVSNIVRWSNAGGGYTYDAAFAGDVNVSGYPKGARVLRSDGTGYWLNLTDGNIVDPESAGAVAAGWVPDFTSGVAAITMTSSNVTLTPSQYGKPIIVITGALTANLNLIFPAIATKWTIVNNTTGNFSITGKTALGSGVIIGSTIVVVCDGINLLNSTSASTPVGQCFLSKSGVNLLLSPKNGNKLTVNGINCTIPSAGVSLAATGLTAGTLYYIYAVATSGVITSIEASITGHSTDSNTGVEIKTGDATRTLVGMVRPIAGPAFADTPAQRFVASWYNRRSVITSNSFASNRTTSSAAIVEISSAERAEFLTWSDESCFVTIASAAFQNTAGSFSTQANFGATVVCSVNISPPSGQSSMVGPAGGVMLAEGYNYATLFGNASVGWTATWIAGSLVSAQIRI